MDKCSTARLFTIKTHHIYLNARQGFVLDLALKLECKALNQTVQSQTKACTAKSSCEICVLLGYYAAESGNCLLTFWDNILAPSSEVKKSKRQNTA